MPKRFIDASVFVHAYLKPKRGLKEHERRIKRQARSIVSRVNRGEDVVTSVVHLAEVANLLEDWMALGEAREVQLGLCTRDSVTLLPVGRGDLVEALAAGLDADVGTSDALAAVLMRSNEISEVYSFDRDFDRFEDLRRVVE